jgi:hypothetical protein
MRMRIAWIPWLLILLGCGPPEPVTFDATVTFSVVGGKPSSSGPVTSKQAVTFLAVEKAGRTRIVDAWQEGTGADEIYGRHKFPPHCGPSGLASYYTLVLANSGWERGTDYAYDEESATLRFSGIRHLEAGADIDEIRVVVEREAISDR